MQRDDYTNLEVNKFGCIVIIEGRSCITKLDEGDEGDEGDKGCFIGEEERRWRNKRWWREVLVYVILT